ncbi:MAG: hypothetical protein SOV58_05695 [Candidatus Enteromonas sp.]|nr:hypothetical protein [Candidatus Enteromonas sp.]
MKLFKPIFFLAASALLASCGTSPISSASSSEEIASVDMQSPSAALASLAKAKNYTIDVEIAILGSSSTITPFDTHQVVFTPRTYSYITSQYEFGYAQGADGVFPYSIEGTGVLPGEVLRDKDGKAIPSLWNSGLFGSLASLEGTPVDQNDEFAISNKSARLALLDIAGLSRDNYPSLSNLTASIVEGQLSIGGYLTVEEKVYHLSYAVKDVNSSRSDLIAEYLEEGHGAFVPGESLQAIRDLFYSNNYTHYYTDASGAIQGYERFHPDYYVFTCGSEMMSQGYFPSGMVGLDHKKDPATGISYDGCYSLTPSSTDNGKNIVDFTVMSSFPYNSSTRDVAEAYTYPSYLQLWENLQFVQEYQKDLPHAGIEEAYVIYDVSVAEDFAKNFGYLAWLSENGYQAKGVLIEAKDLDTDPVVYLSLLLHTGDYLEFEFGEFSTTYVPLIDQWLSTLVDA